MSSSPTKCARCGTPKSVALFGNCPNCLIDLGAPEAASDLTRASGPLPSLGDYELQGEIARGGMGVIYRARQLSLNRIVAVKVLLAGPFANPAFIQRFRREAEAAASLTHPHIVSIHEVGEHEGRPYFSMELIEGRSLSDLVRETPLPAREAARLLQTIAEAVQFAHERGVLHRDLKPSNVLIDPRGVPHITDFGLAKRLELPTGPAAGATTNESSTASPASPVRSRSEDDLTLTGQVLGSPNFMPPEQADPKRGPATVTSDVYSLGAILYHLITGRPPFLAESIPQTLRLVAEGEIVPPRLLSPGLSPDLETVCLKCLETEPGRRYATARELAADLGQYLEDKPICARPVGPLGRLARWRRRKPALAASLAAAAMLLIIVLIGMPVAFIRIDNARNRAEAARHRAEVAERKTEVQLYTALLEQARATVRSGEMGQRFRALDAIRRAASLSNTADLRREAVAALVLPDLRFEDELSIETGTDRMLTELDPAFARLALGRGTGSVEILSVPDQRRLAQLSIEPPDRPVDGRWSPSGRYLAIRVRQPYNSLHRVEVWDIPAARRLLLSRGTWSGAFAFHPSEPRVLTENGNDHLRLSNIEDATTVAMFNVTGLVHHIAFSPDGRSFLVQHRIGAPWFTSLYDAETGALRRRTLTGWVDGIAWERNDRWLAFALRNGEIHLHNRRTDETSVLGRHEREARTAIFTGNGDHLFTCGDEQEILCWDVRHRRRAFSIGPRSADVQAAAAGARCAVVTGTSVQLYSLELPSVCRELEGDLGGSVHHATFSPDGRWLAVGGATRLGVWDLSGDAPAALPFEAERAKAVFSPDSSELIAFNELGTKRWRVRPGPGDHSPPQLSSLPVATSNRVYSAQFVGAELILGDALGVVRVPDFGRGTNLHHAGTLGYTVAQVSPNGLWLAARKQQVIVACRLDPWAIVHQIEAGGMVLAHAFTPASDELVVASRTGLTFFETNRWEPRRRLAVPVDRNARLIFTPDGLGFWLARDARNAAFYDLRTLEEKLPLPRNVTPVALSAEGRWLAVEVDARRLQVWDLEGLQKQLRELGLGNDTAFPVTTHSK